MLILPNNNKLESYTLQGDPLSIRPPENKLNRVAFAAAHVISDPLRQRNPWDAQAAIDWEATLRFREMLWNQGLGLAEAMDTSQRGMGIGWPIAKALITRTMAAAKRHPLQPRVACGAGTDHEELEKLNCVSAIIAAYELQMEAIEAAGGQLIIMASRALPAINATAGDYLKIYSHLIEQASEPVILHWLGEIFDPQLSTYWGSASIADATKVVLKLIHAHSDKIDGIKISLLNEQHEVDFRAQLPADVKLYTGDDYHYMPLIAGDGKHYSHALLGIFAAISPAASQALDALAGGDRQTFESLLQPTVALSREMFKSPTRFYKSGVAFMAWLNAMQPHFIMPMGLQSAREINYYANLYRLADQARLLLQPDIAEARMKTLLQLHGIYQH